MGKTRKGPFSARQPRSGLFTLSSRLPLRAFLTRSPSKRTGILRLVFFHGERRFLPYILPVEITQLGYRATTL